MAEENGHVNGVKLVRKKLTVRDIKDLEPKAAVYELNPYSNYIVMIKKSSLVGGNELAKQKAQTILQIMSQMEIPCAVLIGVDDDVKFIELEVSKR